MTDGQGGIDVDDLLVTVQDATAPVVDCTTDLISLWPPNHTMRDVEISIVVSDHCADPEDVQLYGTVSSNEADDSRGDGSFTGDVDGLDEFTEPVVVQTLVYDAVGRRYVGTIRLRAERDGGEAGRIYSIVCDAGDSEGNLSTVSASVVVPHHRFR